MLTIACLSLYLLTIIVFFNLVIWGFNYIYKSKCMIIDLSVQYRFVIGLSRMNFLAPFSLLRLALYNGYSMQ